MAKKSMRELINQNKLRNFNLWIKVKHKCSMVYHIVARKAIVLMTVAFLRSKGLAPPVAPRTTCLRWVAMCHVAMQLWVCAESNYLCKHKVTLNTHPQSTIARTSLPFSVASRLQRTFESLAVHPRKFVCQSISVCSRSADRSSSP